MFLNNPQIHIGYAHPLEHHSYKKSPSKEKMPDVINALIEKLTSAYNNKNVFVENYYQSYNSEFTQNIELQNAIKKIVINEG